MPDYGYYEKRPRPEAVDKLKEYLGNSKVVTSVSDAGDQVISIERGRKSTLTVFMTNIYTVSEADVAEILAANPGTDAIVTMSGWNGYTNDAKAAAKAKGVGLFKFKEMLGAVYYDGKKFLDYTPPDPRN